VSRCLQQRILVSHHHCGNRAAPDYHTPSRSSQNVILVCPRPIVYFPVLAPSNFSSSACSTYCGAHDVSSLLANFGHGGVAGAPRVGVEKKKFQNVFDCPRTWLGKYSSMALMPMFWGRAAMVAAWMSFETSHKVFACRFRGICFIWLLCPYRVT
jgi:hypothetical protein